MATKYIDIYLFMEALAQELGDIEVIAPSGEFQGYSTTKIKKILWSLPEADIGCASIKRGAYKYLQRPR